MRAIGVAPQVDPQRVMLNDRKRKCGVAASRGDARDMPNIIAVSSIGDSDLHHPVGVTSKIKGAEMHSTRHVFAAMTLAALLPMGAAAQSVTCGQSYTVASGDTLSKISIRVYGKSAFQIVYEANLDRIGDNPNKIFIGQVLSIPCLGEGTVTAAVETAPDASPSEALVLTFNKSSVPKFVINSSIIDLFLAEITEVTEGRVTFVDPPVTNRDAAAQFGLVTTGAVDGAYVFNGHLTASHPLLQLPMIPLMGGSAEQTAVSLWRTHEAHFAQSDYFDDAKLLGFIAAPAAHIWRLSDKPVELNQNIAGKNDFAVPYFAGLDTRGPKAVQQETAAMLENHNEEQNGTLTFMMAHGAARAAGIWNDERTVTEVDNGIYTPTFSVVLSNEAWGRISDADKTAIEAVSGERLAARSTSWDAFDNGHRRHMITTGLNITKASDALLAELKTVSEQRIGGWKLFAGTANVNADAALQTYRETLDLLEDRLLFK